MCFDNLRVRRWSPSNFFRLWGRKMLKLGNCIILQLLLEIFCRIWLWKVSGQKGLQRLQTWWPLLLLLFEMCWRRRMCCRLGSFHGLLNSPNLAHARNWLRPLIIMSLMFNTVSMVLVKMAIVEFIFCVFYVRRHIDFLSVNTLVWFLRV